MLRVCWQGHAEVPGEQCHGREPGEGKQTAMTFVFVAVGIALIAITVFDIFLTLLHPEDQGTITSWISWFVWHAFKALPLSLLTYTGPVAYLAVLLTWALVFVLGGAFIYMPFLPDAFVFDPGLGDEHREGFIAAFYLSLVTAATLGYGDISPTTGWLRLMGPAQAMIGLLLLTAAITWIMAIYQDIEARRSLAHETTLLQQALEEHRIELIDLRPESAEQLVSQVTTRLVTITGSLNQFPITYYFRISDDRQSLAVMALFLLELSDELDHEDVSKEVRLQATMLSLALDHFAEALQARFIDAGQNASTRDVLETYARDHRRDIPQQRHARS